MTAVLELAADQRRRSTGAAKAIADPELEPDDSGGTADTGGNEPPFPPDRGRRRRRPDPPPRWLRLACYGAMLILCFFVGYAIGKACKAIDEAAWGPR